MLLLITCRLYAQSVVNTVHNMSATSSNTIKATNDNEVCIFCHTPHGSRPVAPLWNKNDPGSSYTLYNSSTLDGTSGQPDGSSILCLSCHDGTIALGNLVSRESDIAMVGGITTMPVGGSNLQTDLSDDHPVSYVYSSGDTELNDPGALGSLVKLETGKIQCVSCHDPHKNTYTKFLVDTNENSLLCITCHNKTGWTGSSHESSTATWNGSGADPWAHIEFPYSTVQKNACENCHDPHNSAEKIRLLKSGVFETNCTGCHDGSVAQKDILSDISKAYSHSGYSYSQHDPNESISPLTPHVVCVDCHDPHQVTTGNPLNKVPGINSSGNPVSTITNLYELCFRCHSGPNAYPPSPTSRLLGPSNDVRVDFGPTNISKHPVLAPSDGNGRALKPAWQAPGVIIQCTDCHASDNAANAGPHGSIYPRILKANYNLSETLPSNPVLSVEFALCFQCHDQTGVENLHSVMKGGHFLSYTTCNTCHDPHGFSGGNATNNSYLINLSTTATGPNQTGSHNVVMNLNGTGTCNFTCHAKSHTHRDTGGNY